MAVANRSWEHSPFQSFNQLADAEGLPQLQDHYYNFPQPSNWELGYTIISHYHQLEDGSWVILSLHSFITKLDNPPEGSWFSTITYL